MKRQSHRARIVSRADRVALVPARKDVWIRRTRSNTHILRPGTLRTGFNGKRGKFFQIRRRRILSEDLTFYSGSFRVGPFYSLTRGFSLSTVKGFEFPEITSPPGKP